MDGQHDTRDGSSSRPGALLKIPIFHMGLQYARWTQNIIIILTGEDDIARFDSWRYTKKATSISLESGSVRQNIDKYINHTTQRYYQQHKIKKKKKVEHVILNFS